jgi:site-specific DNA recombinase
MWTGGPIPIGYRVENRKLMVEEAGAAVVLRVFEMFAELGSATRMLPVHQQEGLRTGAGRFFDKGAIYKLLANRTYVGETHHKGSYFPGEHQRIIPQPLWDKVHAILQQSPRLRGSQTRAPAAALLRGLLFGADGRAMSPTHSCKNGKIYRYYTSQAVIQGGANGRPYSRLPAGEIEAVVMKQVRALLRAPEVVVGTRKAALVEVPDLTEDEVREALARLDPIWEELFPAEQERIVRLLVERVVVSEAGAEITLNLDGLAGLARDMRAAPHQQSRAA